MRDDKDNLIVSLTFQFALEVIKFTELLEREKKYVIAKQLLRSGTSVGANVREAQNASSKADFINKMKIAAKELDESIYWMELCEAAESYPYSKELAEKAASINRVLSKIIASSKKNT